MTKKQQPKKTIICSRRSFEMICEKIPDATKMFNLVTPRPDKIYIVKGFDCIEM